MLVKSWQSVVNPLPLSMTVSSQDERAFDHSSSTRLLCVYYWHFSSLDSKASLLF